MNPARKRAQQIIEDLHIDDPALLSHLHEICIERGAYVREDPIDNAEARLTVSGDRGIITINPGETYASRKRFSIAHELGHFELHRHSGESIRCSQRDMNEWAAGQDEASCRREAEANEFASELLMPEKFFKRAVQYGRPGLRLLTSLSTRFQTSLFATVRRFLDVTDEACAAVFFKEEVVNYSLRSPLFEEKRFWIKEKLDPGSFACQAAQRNPVPDYMTAVRADAWLDVPKILGGESILEQARWFSNLGYGMSLLWINSEKLLQYQNSLKSPGRKRPSSADRNR